MLNKSSKFVRLVGLAEKPVNCLLKRLYSLWAIKLSNVHKAFQLKFANLPSTFRKFEKLPSVETSHLTNHLLIRLAQWPRAELHRKLQTTLVAEQVRQQECRFPLPTCLRDVREPLCTRRRVLRKYLHDAQLHITTL